MSTESLFYVKHDGDIFGPYDLSTLRTLSLLPDTQVMSADSGQWLTANQMPRLEGYLDTEGPAFTPPPQSSDSQIITENNPTIGPDTRYYFRRGTTACGPYDIDGLYRARKNEDCPVSVDEMASWHDIDDIDGLREAYCRAARREPLGSHLNNKRDEATIEPPRHTPHGDHIEALRRALHDLRHATPASTPYVKVFPSLDAELADAIATYENRFESLLDGMNRLIEVSSRLDGSSSAIYGASMKAREAVDSFQIHFDDLFAEILQKFAKTPSATSTIDLGFSELRFAAPFSDISLRRRHFLKILADKHLLVTYDDSMRHQAYELVDSVVGRVLGANAPGSIMTIVVDINELNGLADSFKKLDREIYRVVTRSEEVGPTLSALQNRVTAIIRNLLTDSDTTLRQYNDTRDAKEPYTLVVIKDFAETLRGDAVPTLRRLMATGPRAGVFFLLISGKKSFESSQLYLPEDEINRFDFNDSAYELLDLPVDSSEGYVEMPPRFTLLDPAALKAIVDRLSLQSAEPGDLVVPIGDYLSPREAWWRGDSARQIDIPFGITSDRTVKGLKISQESGQNSAVVIGIPGSGKSVFLHSLILNAAIKYSPDALRMYLIDFSGVEFNAYAVGKLPHASVIAPEAEREFGLSILNELVEEGSRRMELCRRHNVSNIVDLRRVAPDVKAPRLLVIIDEFQKLFEIENDNISREANAKIHIIIQEFRKFGINLILATQKLPSASLLPRDLIANRVVFKSAPADFAQLIENDGARGAVKLRAGQCVYNSESGAAFDNIRVQGFYASNTDIARILREIDEFQASRGYQRPAPVVFRSADLPDFAKRRVAPRHRFLSAVPAFVPVYFGESIALSQSDVNIELREENANNILIIGGDAEVGRKIAFNAMMSMTTCHEARSAEFVVVTGMRRDVALTDSVIATFDALPFLFSAPTSEADIVEELRRLKDEIDRRRADQSVDRRHIYLTVFDFHNAGAFDRDTSGRIEKPSAAASLLEAIVRNGPSVGVFTTLQVDNLESLARGGALLSAFNYRVALQMPELDSNKVVGSAAANKLFVFNRPSSRFRAFLRDNNRNLSIKFKPYK